MNRIYLCVLPLALFLAGSPGFSVAQETECVKPPANTPPCKEVGEPQTKIVNLNLKGMTAAPYCIRAYPGTTIVFILTPKKDLKRDTVEIMPKDDFDSWLRGKNDEVNDLIIIKVPGTYNPDEPKTEERKRTVHHYSITAPGKCLDPRVEVEH